MELERADALYQNQELLKALGRARQEKTDLEQDKQALVDQLVVAHDLNGTLEERIAQEEEGKILACSQLDTLKEEIEYLRGQVKIYQMRLGLLPQERQGEIEAGPKKPLRAARVPFAVAAAKIQVERTEEYWRGRAAAVDLEGVTGKTTTDSQTVSDKES